MHDEALKNSPGNGEFSNSSKTSLTRAILDFIKQSERKKPYIGKDFPEMEHDWEGPIGGFNPMLGPNLPDQPWNMQVPSAGAVFNADSDSEWCPGDTQEIVITGTEPIYLLTVTWPTRDVYISGGAGFGSNLVVAQLTVGDDVRGRVTVEASMRTFDGIPGDSNVSLYESTECDDCPLSFVVDPANPETVAPSSSVTVKGIGGLGPYSWSISGSGFSLTGGSVTATPENDIATSGACGSGIATVTDSCGSEITIEVRSTTGSWVFYGSGCMVDGLDPDPGTGGEIATSGQWQQRCNWVQEGGCSTSSPPSCGCADTGPSGCADLFYLGTGVECINFVCVEVMSPAWNGSWPCCQANDNSACRVFKNQFNHIYRWQC
jgi:hypothetical protein